MADLKTAFEQLVKALNSRDLNTLSALWHEQITTFQPNSPFPLDGPAMQRRVFQSLFDNAESIIAIPINPQFRVVGDIGMVWGHFTLMIKPKDGLLQTSFVRSTLYLDEGRREMGRVGSPSFKDSDRRLTVALALNIPSP